MVGAGVLLLMLALASLTLVSYLRATHRLSRQEFPADAMTRSLQRCSQLLRSTQAVLEPPGDLTTAYQPRRPRTPPFVVRVRREQGVQVVGLTVEGARLVEIDYAGEYDASEPYPPDARYRVLGPCSGLSIRREDGMLRLLLESGSGEPAWQTALDFYGVP